ncbi:MAG: hypothetical protein ACD_21C00282G0001 [uncultured bacterium]|nr:MAG: hypothetical protein ACD_21C00282G0001 [uncultured bacterium]
MGTETKPKPGKLNPDLVANIGKVFTGGRPLANPVKKPAPIITEASPKQSVTAGTTPPPPSMSALFADINKLKKDKEGSVEGPKPPLPFLADIGKAGKLKKVEGPPEEIKEYVGSVAPKQATEGGAPKNFKPQSAIGSIASQIGGVKLRKSPPPSPKESAQSTEAPWAREARERREKRAAATMKK